MLVSRLGAVLGAALVLGLSPLTAAEATGDDYCDPQVDAIECATMTPAEAIYVNLPGILTVSRPLAADLSVPASVGVVDLAAQTGKVNLATGEVSEIQETTLQGGFAVTSLGGLAPSGQAYSCQYSGTNKYFSAYSPITTSGSETRYQWRWQFNPYSQYYARRLGSAWTWQFEVCAAGGVDGQNGWRSFYSASVMAANSSNANNRIGLAADSNGDGTAASSIQVSASAGPITISGALPTSGGGTNFGQFGRPKYPSSGDQYYQTQSFAGWRAGCTYSRLCGSPNMQSQVHNGLFEFYHGDWNRKFPLDVQWNIYCAGPFGQNCG